jgi:hypothetical protein
MLQTYLTRQWDESLSTSDQEQAITSLETGQILHLPELAFSLSSEETQFLTPHYADPDAKNIGYHSGQNKLWGVRQLTDQQHTQLKAMLERFSRSAFKLIQATLPSYASQLIVARTSFRPVQVSNRKTSYRKDDRRLHVDAFPSAPNQGKRILRVFCNINPEGKNRIWRVGEPFQKVADRFVPQIKKPIPGLAAALRLLRVTKSYRTPYDHYMLRMHNLMKADEDYQQKAPQQEIHFRPGSTWIVQTDHVSHAAMQGQHVLEQTFYLPVSAMLDESRSPLKVLEKMLNTRLA